MACSIKRDSNSGPTRRRTASGRYTSFMPMNPKSTRRAKPASHHATDEAVRVPLTDADIARIDAICAEPTPPLTDHMIKAIERYRKHLRA